MAALRNRSGKWEARIRRKGQPTLSKSFQSKQDAEKWSRSIESGIGRGTYTKYLIPPTPSVIDKNYLEIYY
jgi:hypothetical protein